VRAVAAGVTDVGLQRDHNEDSFAILEEHTLYIVADGMGGHRAGDVASKLATEAIVDFFRATATEDFTWPFHFDARLSEEENRLLTGIRIANRQNRECSRPDERDRLLTFARTVADQMEEFGQDCAGCAEGQSQVPEREPASVVPCVAAVEIGEERAGIGEDVNARHSVGSEGGFAPRRRRSCCVADCRPR